MQLILSVRNVAVGTALLVGAYYGHRALFADMSTRDMGKLIRSYRDAQPARQLLLKRRIIDLYQPAHDYETFLAALDAPSPVTQALAVEVLAAKGERRAVPRLLSMLSDPGRTDIVQQELANAFARFPTREAVARLIELTDVAEPLAVRSAAHNTLRTITRCGGEIKLSEASREHWTLWWRDHPNVVTN
jgi:hypothetical protein